jgi:hypothetical protein
LAISYVAPLERAWTRTRRLLFERFAPETWIVVSFAAFLAGLVGGWAGLGFSPGRGIHLSTSLDSFVLTPRDLFVHSNFSRVWALGIPLLLLAILVTVLLLWISSRGKFIFLDNLIHERGAIVEPWRRYARLGDSLFLWRLGLALSILVICGTLIWPVVFLGANARHWGGVGSLGMVVGVAAGAIGLVIGIVAAYIALLLEGFVVPLMYQRNITATAGWRTLQPLVLRHPTEFLLFGLAVAAAWLLVAACLFVVGVSTCCLLFFILSIPYLNAIVLLPLSTVFRLYTVEFLGQFGSEYTIVGSAVDARTTNGGDLGRGV